MEQMSDTQFMKADEKRRVLRQWEAFLKGGLKRSLFTKALYNHLIMHCSFIAHYNLGGFYETYFLAGDDIATFFSQFDGRRDGGSPPSVELGMSWINGEYADINREMVVVATRWIPGILKSAAATQKIADVSQAQALLAKHGMTV